MALRVVVGVDGSSAAGAALEWSLEVAANYRADVDALHVWHWPLPHPLPVVPDLPAQLAELARETVDAELARAMARRSTSRPPVHASARTAGGDPGLALVAAATGAELLVLGRHGQSQVSRRLVGQLLGSVAGFCLSKSSAPVVVVPAGAEATAPSRVVVGVDGSKASAGALRWAHGHARAVGSKVTAVLAWQLTTLPAPSSWTGGAVPPLPEWHRNAERLLDEVCAAALDADAPDIEQLVLHQPAAAGLLAAARPEDVLVLGDRGRGGFSRLVLGSVSRQCAEYAPCPVVVVPHRERADAAGA